VEDAEGNLTDYVYDAHDRLVRTRFPCPNTAHTACSGIDENYTYDANGNVLSFETRLDEVLSFTWDALNRLKLKEVPERGGLDSAHTRDVYYSYDLAGNLTAARFNSASSGPGIHYTYDALGRRLSETSDFFTSPRTLGFAYDALGRGIALTFDDAVSFTYDYTHTNRLDRIRKGTAETLVTFGYGSAGELTGIVRAGNAPLSGSCRPQPGPRANRA
jgi:YD repeat-containing protein